jgi:hypothetical protein
MNEIGLIFVQRLPDVNFGLGRIEMVIIICKLAEGSIRSLAIKRSNKGVPIHGIIIHWNIITQTLKIRNKFNSLKLKNK